MAPDRIGSGHPLVGLDKEVRALRPGPRLPPKSARGHQATRKLLCANEGIFAHESQVHKNILLGIAILEIDPHKEKKTSGGLLLVARINTPHPNYQCACTDHIVMQYNHWRCEAKTT